MYPRHLPLEVVIFHDYEYNTFLVLCYNIKHQTSSRVSIFMRLTFFSVIYLLCSLTEISVHGQFHREIYPPVIAIPNPVARFIGKELFNGHHRQDTVIIMLQYCGSRER